MPTETNACTEFGCHLRSLRAERGLSQEELANLAGLDRTYISSCEAGRRNVTLRTLIRLAKALGITPEEMLPEFSETAIVGECE
ncbi:MAG: helix-turn-helix domain-containing protein [Coriobacteriia bacterium]|nr:helix-turn-helix domain-containing protein [Coriobacteriia bacterium]